MPCDDKSVHCESNHAQQGEAYSSDDGGYRSARDFRGKRWEGRAVSERRVRELNIPDTIPGETYSLYRLRICHEPNHCEKIY